MTEKSNGIAECYESIYETDARMYAEGMWDWETFQKMMLLHARFEQEDYERLESVPDGS